MPKWTKHNGPALVFPYDNVDTDQLIPARFMSVPRADGYGDFLLPDMRRDPEGKLLPGFPLNQHSQASVLVTGRNFGSGSSREAAVYALVDTGVRAVVSTSLGDIFSANAVNNGLIPARVEANDHDLLVKHLGDQPAEVSIGLETRQIAIGSVIIPFELDETWRVKLVNGWDDIDLTRQKSNEIAAFRQNRMHIAAWSWPGAGREGGN